MTAIEKQVRAWTIAITRRKLRLKPGEILKAPNCSGSPMFRAWANDLIGKSTDNSGLLKPELRQVVLEARQHAKENP